MAGGHGSGHCAVLPMAVGLHSGTASGGHPGELKLISRQKVQCGEWE